MNNDGNLNIDDITVYNVDSNGIETVLPVKTIAGCGGYQKWGFSSATTKSSPTGLTNDTTTYTATISVDGSSNSISVVGSDAQTINDLITEINSDLTGATATWDSTGDGYIQITSNSSGDQASESSISISDTDLFSSLTNINASVETAVSGVSNKAYPGQFVLESAPTNGNRIYITYEYCNKDPSEPDEMIKMACVFLSIAYCYAKLNIGRAPIFSVGNKKIYRDMDSFSKYNRMAMNFIEEINIDGLSEVTPMEGII